METHPDVTKNKKGANEERFKRISHAHSVLSNDKARQQYNAELDSPTRFRYEGPQEAYGSRGSAGRPTTRNYNGYSSARMHFLDGIYKPRNLFLGITLGLVAVSVVKSYSDKRDEEHIFGRRTGKKHLVEAWYNPHTKRFEQPAPWDALYKKLKPEHQLVPRELVQPRSK